MATAVWYQTGCQRDQRISEPKMSSCYPAPNICSCVDMRAFHWRVIENLNLRVAPDPRSANALSSGARTILSLKA